MRIRHAENGDNGILPHSQARNQSTHGTLRDHNANSKNLSAGLHGERLHRMVVFEIREDGSSEYFTMTLRSLYNSVVRTITDNCKEVNREKVRQQRREMMQQWDTTDDVAGDAEGGKDGIVIGALREDGGKGTISIGSGAAGPTAIVDRDSGEGTDQTELKDNANLTASSIDGPTITLPTSFVHPHYLPSLTSSHDVLPTTAKRNTERKELYQRSQEKLLTSALSNSITSGGGANRATYRERLGGYLHPRDMRRLVTPFSSSNEPQLIVRRHAMLLNFDPLRAIVSKDRLLVLVPDGADSILIALEGRVRGGIAEMTNQVFGNMSDHDSPPSMLSHKSSEGLRTNNRSSDRLVETDTVTTDGEDNEYGIYEWEDIQKMDWQDLPFELQSVDAILQTVTSMLMEDVKKVHGRAEHAMGELRGDSPNKSGGRGLTEYAQERLRLHKDEVNLMDRRVQGFVRAINQVLDEDEDMTLMNLSRLLTHPERFVQPVSREVLEEESDEPELILETYLQQALSIVNTLDLLKGQIMTTHEQISMTLDALRNRLLFINTLLSVASLCVTLGSYIGAIFGMNIANPIMEMKNADGSLDYSYFKMVTWWTSAAIFTLWVILSYTFYKVTNTPTFRSYAFRRGDHKKAMTPHSIHYHPY